MKKAISVSEDSSTQSEMPDWAYPIIPINIIYIVILSVLGGFILFISLLGGFVILLLDMIIIYLLLQVTKGSKIALLVNVSVLVLLLLLIIDFYQNLHFSLD
ncbi:MAG: hypothetical protein HeimC2_27600 [Candidatus Heimdallarchaeota archaeon LC_2]|nr:MAG: hypothetical protein HeimC2_27600 [Candidatus Heimdallarchaeota archaeon LC_2]